MMANLTSITWLLAQVSREEFGRGFRGATSQLSWLDLVPYAVAAIVGGVGIALCHWIKKRNDMTESCDDPPKLFRELCTAHRLDRPSRRLLANLAETWQFAQPAQVFVTPTAFEPERLPPNWQKKAAELKRLRERLF
jgi:hypothetical protein